MIIVTHNALIADMANMVIHMKDGKISGIKTTTSPRIQRKSYGKNSLFLKSIRDMKNAKAQFISIFIMAALSVTIVTGLDSV